MKKNEQVDFARQFMPFDALKGFRESLSVCECQWIEKKELSEEHWNKVNDKIKTLEKGETIQVIYYEMNLYHSIIGVFSHLDFTKKVLYVDKAKIKMNDLVDINEWNNMENVNDGNF